MSKKKKNKKPARYQPFGHALGVDTTFIQAAMLLDNVSMSAYKTNDTKLMMEVAGSWLQLGALMHAAFSGEHEEKPDEEDGGAAILGFGNTEAREKAEALNRDRNKG